MKNIFKLIILSAVVAGCGKGKVEQIKTSVFSVDTDSFKQALSVEHKNVPKDAKFFWYPKLVDAQKDITMRRTLKEISTKSSALSMKAAAIYQKDGAAIKRFENLQCGSHLKNAQYLNAVENKEVVGAVGELDQREKGDEKLEAELLEANAKFKNDNCEAILAAGNVGPELEACTKLKQTLAVLEAKKTENGKRIEQLKQALAGMDAAKVQKATETLTAYKQLEFIQDEADDDDNKLNRVVECQKVLAPMQELQKLSSEGDELKKGLLFQLGTTNEDQTDEDPRVRMGRGKSMFAPLNAQASFLSINEKNEVQLRLTFSYPDGAGGYVHIQYTTGDDVPQLPLPGAVINASGDIFEARFEADTDFLFFKAKMRDPRTGDYNGDVVRFHKMEKSPFLNTILYTGSIQRFKNDQGPELDFGKASLTFELK